MKKKKRPDNVFYGWLELGFLGLICPALGVLASVLAFTLSNEAKNNQIEAWMIIMMTSLTLATFLFGFWGIFVCWMRVEIDEKGARRSLFKHLFKREICWDEIKDIRVIGEIGFNWLYFSKKSLLGVTHNKAPWMRGMIRLFYTEKVHECIRKYTDISVKSDIEIIMVRDAELKDKYKKEAEPCQSDAEKIKM